MWESSPDSKELPISISSCTYVLNIPSNYWSDFATCILSGQWHQRWCWKYFERSFEQEFTSLNIWAWFFTAVQSDLKLPTVAAGPCFYICTTSVGGLPVAPETCCARPPFRPPPPQFYNLTRRMPWPLNCNAAAMSTSAFYLLLETTRESATYSAVES